MDHYPYKWWQENSFTLFVMNRPLIFEKKFKKIVPRKYMVSDIISNEDRTTFKLVLQTRLSSCSSETITKSGIEIKFPIVNEIEKLEVYILKKKYMLVHGLSESVVEQFKLFFEKELQIELTLPQFNRQAIMQNVQTLDFDSLRVGSGENYYPLRSERALDKHFRELIPYDEAKYLLGEQVEITGFFNDSMKYVALRLGKKYNQITIRHLREVNDIFHFLSL